MNKKYLLSSVTAGIALLYANHGTAQCVTTQDCATLGYTETSCPNGGVKCPFGSKWACFPEPDKTANCVIGALYYSDGTCSDKLESAKTLLGVVIYEKSASQMGWIMTVKPVKTGIAWSTKFADIPGLTNITSESNLTDIQASCTNTDVITAYGNSSTYPVAWAAKNYKPTGTPSGKSWCLPSGGLLRTALDNSVNFAKVNAGITIAGGTILGNVSSGYEHVWSSSEYSSTHAWYFYADTSGSFNMSIGKSYSYSYDSVRPVMSF